MGNLPSTNVANQHSKANNENDEDEVPTWSEQGAALVKEALEMISGEPPEVRQKTFENKVKHWRDSSCSITRPLTGFSGSVRKPLGDE